MLALLDHWPTNHWPACTRYAQAAVQQLGAYVADAVAAPPSRWGGAALFSLAGTAPGHCATESGLSPPHTATLCEEAGAIARPTPTRIASKVEFYGLSECDNDPLFAGTGPIDSNAEVEIAGPYDDNPTGSLAL
jgi:hypothetical protein